MEKLLIVSLSLIFFFQGKSQNVFPSSGNVGIGTTSPNYPIDVVKSVFIGGDVGFSVLENSSGGYFRVRENTSFSGSFFPTFDFKSSGLNGYGGVIIGNIDPIHDQRYSSANLDAAIVVDARRSDNTAIQNANAFTVRTIGKALFSINANGNVAVGNIYNPSQKLTVDGQVLSEEVRVVNNILVPDYVFDEDYKLSKIEEKELFIKMNKHLPSLKSANQVKEEGSLAISEFVLGLLKELEELTLHTIELSKRVKELESKLAQIEN